MKRQILTNPQFKLNNYNTLFLIIWQMSYVEYSYITKNVIK